MHGEVLSIILCLLKRLVVAYLPCFFLFMNFSVRSNRTIIAAIDKAMNNGIPIDIPIDDISLSIDSVKYIIDVTLVLSVVLVISL